MNNQENCLNCKHNGGDVCLGYGTIPSEDELDDCTYAQPIEVLLHKLANEPCDDYVSED